MDMVKIKTDIVLTKQVLGHFTWMWSKLKPRARAGSWSLHMNMVKINRVRAGPWPLYMDMIKFKTHHLSRAVAGCKEIYILL